ncbi:hypothetical protein ACHAXR_003128, partial [Thalassiosira sp. AJA248-18]
MANAITAIHKTKPPLRYLTKSLFRTALQCPRKLFYAANPTLYPRSHDQVEDPLLKHLAQEGERFGEYCRQLFPHGVEVGTGEASSRLNDTTISESPSLEHLVAQTQHLLTDRYHQDGSERVTVFEGAITHGPFYVRPDILDRVVKPGGSNQIELRLIEVKSKSWDSRHTVESKMLTANKKSIKSTYLPYIQDIAFQKMVCSLAYPEVNVTSFLMLPDRAKKMKSSSGHEGLAGNREPSVEETMQTIDDSIASLVPVDELVEIALSSEVSYPGSSKNETLREAAYRWSESLTDESFDLDSFSPIGTQCSSCEYRLSNTHTRYHRKYSGFDICWQKSTGIGVEELRQRSPVVDLYANSKKSMQTFLSGGKYTLYDLSPSDFDLSEDATPIEDDKKKSTTVGSINKNQRQWFQVQTKRRSRESLNPNYIIKREGLRRSMRKWSYPLHFIDFETNSPVIPYNSNRSPYEVSAFQFSHHTLSQNHDGSLEVHHASEYLATERGVCPDEAFLKALVSHVPSDGGTIFQWSPHENNVLRAMLSSLKDSTSLSSQEISALSKIRNSLVDLCKLAQNYYYVDGSEGSSSMKRLLQPTLNASAHLKSIYETPTYNGKNFKDFSWYQLDECGRTRDPYDILSGVNHDQHDSANITQGGAAAAAFHELQ